MPLLSPPTVYPETQTAEIARIPPNLRQLILDHQFDRHRPDRIEDQITDAIAERRRPAIISAHHHPVGLLYFATADQFQFKTGNVHHDVGVAELIREPSPPLEIRIDLIQALSWRSVEHGQGGFADNTVRIQSVASLKTLDRDLQPIVVDVVRPGTVTGGGKVLQQAQPPAYFR